MYIVFKTAILFMGLTLMLLAVRRMHYLPYYEAHDNSLTDQMNVYWLCICGVRIVIYKNLIMAMIRSLDLRYGEYS